VIHAKYLVLGALEALGQGSGYDVKAHLDKLQVSRWTGVTSGSLYFALKQLARDGHVRSLGRVKPAGYPEKTIYAVTVQGRDLFDRLQEQAFRGFFPDFSGFKLALKLNTRRGREDIVRYARAALERIDGIGAEMDAYLVGLREGSQERLRDAFFIRHDRYLYEAEQKWLNEVIALCDEAAAGDVLPGA
jgi:DNA-binding PadR family transcriptional regulator